MQMVAVAMKQLTDSVPKLGASSEIGQLVLDFVKKVGKIMPAGAAPPQAEENVLQAAMLKQAQQRSMMQQMKQQAMGGQGAPGGPAGPAAAAPRIAA